MIGDVDEKGRQLVHATKLARDVAISACKPGIRYSVIGDAIRWVNNMISINISKALHGAAIFSGLLIYW